MMFLNCFCEWVGIRQSKRCLLCEPRRYWIFLQYLSVLLEKIVGFGQFALRRGSHGNAVCLVWQVSSASAVRASRDGFPPKQTQHCDRHVRSTIVQIRLQAHMKCIIWKMKYNSMFVLFTD